MIVSPEHLLKSSTHTHITPCIPKFYQRIVLASAGCEEADFLLFSLDDTTCHSLLGPLLCFRRIHLDDVHRHAEFQRIGKTLQDVHILKSSPVSRNITFSVIGQGTLDFLLIPLRAVGLIIIVTFHNAVKISLYRTVDRLHIVVCERTLLLVRLQVLIRHRAVVVRTLDACKVEEEQISRLQLRKRIYFLHIQQRNQSLRRFLVGTVCTTVSLQVDGRRGHDVDTGVGIIDMRDDTVLCEGILIECRQILILMRNRGVSFLSAPSRIYTAESNFQIGLYLAIYIIEFLFGNADTVIDRVDLPLPYHLLFILCRLVELGTRNIEVQAGVQCQSGNRENQDCSYIFQFHCR